jgi:hypothetical protein
VRIESGVTTSATVKLQPIPRTPLYRPKARIIAGSVVLGLGRSLLIAGCFSLFVSIADVSDQYYWTKPLTKVGFSLLGSSVGIGLLGTGLMVVPSRSSVP